MAITTDLHHTNDKVMETGKYVCAAGETKELKHGDSFPVCPQTGKETTWRHANHQHKTGEKVTEAGHYQDADGQEVVLKVGDTFPVCPKTGKAISWKHA